LALPLLVAALGAYLVNPMVVRCEELGLRRGPVVVVLFVVATLALVVAVVALAPAIERQTGEIVERLPQLSARLENAAARGHEALAQRLPWIAEHIEAPAAGWPQRLLATQREHATAFVSGAGTVLFVFLLAPVFGFFLLRDGPHLLDSAIALLPPRQIETSVAIWCEIDRIIGRYLRGLVLESLGVAVLATLGLAVLGVPAPLVLGALAGLVNPVPYVGVLLSLTAAAVTALGAGMGPEVLVALVALYGAIRLIDDFVLIPLALGSSVHLHPAIVIAAILAGEHALGVLGMVLAVPLVTVGKEVTRLLLEGAGSRLGRRQGRHGATAAPAYLC